MDGDDGMRLLGYRGPGNANMAFYNDRIASSELSRACGMRLPARQDACIGGSEAMQLFVVVFRTCNGGQRRNERSRICASRDALSGEKDCCRARHGNQFCG